MLPYTDSTTRPVGLFKIIFVMFAKVCDFYFKLMWGLSAKLGHRLGAILAMWCRGQVFRKKYTIKWTIRHIVHKLQQVCKSIGASVSELDPFSVAGHESCYDVKSESGCVCVCVCVCAVSYTHLRAHET